MKIITIQLLIELRRQLKLFLIYQEVEPSFVKIDKTESAIKDADSNLKEAERIVNITLF
jgi:hypothetical protein